MILVKGLQWNQMSNLEVKKISANSALFKPMRPRSAQLADISFNLQLWPLISLQPLDQNQCLVPHLKDKSYFCLETEVQGYGMTFKVYSFGSKQPCFNSSCVVRVPIFSFRIVLSLEFSQLTLPVVYLHRLTKIEIDYFKKWCTPK